METKNKKLTETIESSERSEIIDNNTEEKSNTATELDEIWCQIGDLTLTEGAKSAWQYIKKLKVKHVALGAGVCIGMVSGAIIVFYLSYLLLPLLWTVANDCYAMAIGKNPDYMYSLFDGDLINSIPFCLIVAFIVGLFVDRHKLFHIILYFIMLLSILEIWDYWHIEYGANEILGGLCFVFMFIIVPILYTIRALIPIFSDNEDDDAELLSSEALKSND